LNDLTVTIARYMLSPVRLSQGGSAKTVEVRIRNFHRMVIFTIVFAGKFLPEILMGAPERGHQTRDGWVKEAIF